MKYFNGITDLEQAKLRYRKLAKQLHPDKGGTAVEFQKMQDEYKTLLLQLQQKHKVVSPLHIGSSAENELINELGKLAQVLIKKQVPQNYLRQKMQTTESPLQKSLFGDIADWLDDFSKK
jgi:DnaJ-class molecular chaperone